MHGPSPPQIWGEPSPQPSLGLCPCQSGTELPFLTSHRPTLGKSRQTCSFPLPSFRCFYGDTISSVGVLHHPSFFFLSSGMWGLPLPAKTRSSTMHSASTG